MTDPPRPAGKGLAGGGADARSHPGTGREDTPAVLRQRDLAKAYFGALKEQLGIEQEEVEQFRAESATYGDGSRGRPATPDSAELLALVACEIEHVVRRHAVVRWRDSQDAQNRMRNDFDDLLFRLQQEKGGNMSYTQMDTIIESILRITRNRQDV